MKTYKELQIPYNFPGFPETFLICLKLLRIPVWLSYFPEGNANSYNSSDFLKGFQNACRVLKIIYKLLTFLKMTLLKAENVPR
jgi:hypothetical protein